MYTEKQKIYADLVALSPNGKTLVTFFKENKIIKIYKLFNKNFELNKIISTPYIDNIDVSGSLIAATDSIINKVYVYKINNLQIEEINLPCVYREINYSLAVRNNKIFVGVQHNKKNGRSGTVYIFTKHNNEWMQEQNITLEDGEASGYFGQSFAVSNNTLVIGDWKGNNCKGLVYIFRYVDGVWTQEAKIKAPDGAVSYYFGRTTAINNKGDIIIIGARGNDIFNGINSGCVYVFTRNKDVWTYQTKLTAKNGLSWDQFGSSVAVSDDGKTILVGSDYDDYKGSYSGFVRVFTFDGDTWVEQEKFAAQDTKEYDYFGLRLFAGSNNTFIIGANGYDRNLAYVFSS